ncbi:hypothetical protein [Frigidibacter sp. SD6-1]
MRSAVIKATRVMHPSQVLRTFAACPLQPGLAVALRQIGPV